MPPEPKMDSWGRPLWLGGIGIRKSVKLIFDLFFWGHPIMCGGKLRLFEVDT
jgi:hypothetical protein|tara:strand:+ start:1512 stop:1667 length:156 start_codon:yes stop_codon:yes gene_type:complete